MPGLLVSVRSVPEAAAALEGGAHLIDVKEPARGPLGRADDLTLVQIARFVGGRRPVSAALGELTEARPLPGLLPLDFYKFGLAGCAVVDWRAKIGMHGPWSRPGAHLVLAAYADWHAAGAPCVDDVAAAARQVGAAALLVDTYEKAPDAAGRRPTLLDWLSVARVVRLCRDCHAVGLKVALAGSLGPVQIRALRDASPDWFAVRGAACLEGRRQSAINTQRVRELVQLVEGMPPVPDLS